MNNCISTPPPKGCPAKKAILVVSFGTSYNATRDATIGAIEDTIRSAFPDYEVRRAFTSRVILDKLKKRDGLVIDDVAGALERLAADGVGALIIQPTHVMNGSEYDGLVSEAAPYADRFPIFRIGAPLLTSAKDYRDLAEVLDAEFRIPENTALVLMGHGTEHFANAAYSALAYQFLAGGRQNLLIGTVEGYPGLDDVRRRLHDLHVSRVLLTPLMVVAGDHANNDMAGDGDGSWKSVLQSDGYEVGCILRGLGEYPRVRALYAAHVRAAMEAE